MVTFQSRPPVGTLYIDIGDIYCFGTGLMRTGSKGMHQNRHFKKNCKFTLQTFDIKPKSEEIVHLCFSSFQWAFDENWHVLFWSISLPVSGWDMLKQKCFQYPRFRIFGRQNYPPWPILKYFYVQYGYPHGQTIYQLMAIYLFIISQQLPKVVVGRLWNACRTCVSASVCDVFTQTLISHSFYKDILTKFAGYA